MNLELIYKQFPENNDCIKYLEQIIWGNEPVCPYCRVSYYTKAKNGIRYHCNNCNTSFSVTVRTMFHRSRIPLQKWFLGISIILNSIDRISARKLASKIEVNKDTAWLMSKKIDRAILKQRNLLFKISDQVIHKS